METQVILDKLIDLARTCQSGASVVAKAAGRKFGMILDETWAKTQSDAECNRLIADVETLTGFHYVWP